MATVRVPKDELWTLMKNKLHKAGLMEDHAGIVSDVLLHADLRGAHSHGAMRVEYYAERINKGGTTTNPKFEFNKTGPCSAIFEGDNGAGHVAAKLAMDEAIKMAKADGIAVVGIRRIGHCGALSYFVQQAAQEDLIGVSLCQSDPMAVPYGGAEPYYGTNPIGLSVKGEDGRLITIDLATTVQAWGKILHARSRGDQIPDTWAVDKDGNPTSDPLKVNALVPIAEAKGYGLMMMVDILSGILLGVPFGSQVTSMYNDLTAGRELGQLHIVINPSYFTDLNTFKANITKTMNDLNAIKPAPGFTQVFYPGQRSDKNEKDQLENGVEIVDEIYNYLRSDVIHNNAYDNKGAFAVD